MDWKSISKTNARYIQLTLFGLVVVYLSLLLPNQPGFHYHYATGGKWAYDDMYAPATFGIKRSQAQLDSIRLRITTQSLQYYRSAELSGSQVVDQFIKELYAKLDESNKTNIVIDNVLITYLNKVYNKGVLEEKARAGETVNQNSLFYIVDEDGVVSVQQSRNYKTISEVKEEIIKILSTLGSPIKDSLRGIMDDVLRPTLNLDEKLYQQVLQEDLKQISPFEGSVEQGALIVRQGETIFEETYQKLESLREWQQLNNDTQKSRLLIYAGNLLLMTLTIGLFYLYLQFVEPEMLLRTRKISFLLLWFVLFPTIVYFIEEVDQVSAYIVPFCIVPIVIKNFMNERLAFITVIVLIMIASLITSLGLEYALLMVLAGLVAVLFGTETRYWTRFFTSIFIIFLTFLLGYLGLSLIRGQGLLDINWRIYTALLINVVLTLLAYPIIPLLERLFGFTSSITLAELSDLNMPLLKKLSIKAPGTFHHSIQVSNLAEAASSKIGANSLLAKVGALYHDIGKMKNPMYFIENSGVKSLHDKIDALESGRIILEHVTEGVALAREYKIPQVVIEFIKTHHGTTRVEYFLHKYKAQFPQDADAEAKFTYPGPRPKTREQSVVMLADSIEAASKTLKFKNYAELDAFVDKIIAQKLQGGQMDHSELSFEELEICRKIFKKTLRNIYHGRISYPGDIEE
jgi:cyclic-di-AMP phosphodiesterase PgpH